MRLLLNNQEWRIIKMETKLINYISMLEEEIKRIKNEWYSPNSVGDKEKYFRDHLQKYREEIKELKAENDKLKEKNKRKDYSHYPKEYKREAEEYFEHNPHEEKLFFLMVGGSGCDEDGDVVDTLNVGCDAIAEYDNSNGNISGNTYD